MKKKFLKLLLPFVLLGICASIWLTIVQFRDAPDDQLPLDEVWIFQADDLILATPILIDDQIIIRTASKIYSINAANGSVSWEVIASASNTAININDLEKPVVGNSQFLASVEQNNSISIYSTKSGEQIWGITDQRNFINALEVMNDVMAVSSHDGNLVVYDLASHNKLWEVALPPRSGTPIAINTGVVILGAWDTLRVYGLRDGNLLNEKVYTNSLIGEITLDGSNIFVSHAKEGGDWTISSLQLNSLDENWSFHAGTLNHPYLSATDSLNLFSKTLLLVDKNTGSVLWEDNINEQYSAPAFHENSVFFISAQGLFDKKRICKSEISIDAVVDCSVAGTTGLKQGLHLPGPLVANNLLIIPKDSELIAFTIP